ncbi:DUF5683 domain-containing protein [Candidatus Kryptobacter tengchongensis]|uniref:TM2 domain n=1 Tax=Kryptobacter tengchongensis TaxID=1643429 RepID=A0A916PER7_KRYT1|nr:DUF5683 domain-containing protein [Candidatus Kryptobacter tengchongensis]CUS82192.1 TM2 domain [Candidatus Kryptobacter tengchongensis]CUS97269.1 TM2 domain [Candidatus Kryptobacter tengchongensis]CUT02344.1 TM2 domain [Candidatus Kryptobacter tengchongensis]
MLKRILLLVIFAQSLLLAQSKDSFISKRKLTALTYSTFIPGAGQFYLGHKLKGAVFTLTAFSSLVVTIVSQNNLVGGNERLENLEIQYQSTMNWEKAEQIWQEMLQVKSDIDRDYKRRNLFLGITAGIWVANIIDVLFFTSDKGSGDIFGESASFIGIESKNGNFMISAKFKF